MRNTIIVIFFSLASFIPVTIIGYMNMPTGISVVPDTIRKIEKPKPSPSQIITLPEVVIIEKRARLPVPLKTISSNEPKCTMQPLLTDSDAQVKVCE